VIISNLIQLEKAVRRIDHDPPPREIDLDADLPAQGDEDFPRARLALDHEESRFPQVHDVLHRPDRTAVGGDDPAADQIEIIDPVVLGPPQGVLGNENLPPDQGVGRGQGIDPLELEEMEVFIGKAPLDVELSKFPPIVQKNFKKKPSGT
jgi:hypothetical protein